MFFNVSFTNKHVYYVYLCTYIYIFSCIRCEEFPSKTFVIENWCFEFSKYYYHGKTKTLKNNGKFTKKYVLTYF